MRALTPVAFGELPAVGGYNLCYVRPEAMMGVVTVDEYEAPLVASWNVGAGRVLCYTGETDGEFTGPMGRWEKVGTFHTSLARWVVGEQPKLPDSMVLTQDVVEGVCRIRLHLDPQVQANRLNQAPTVTTLRDVGTGSPLSSQTTMAWAATDVLETGIPLDGNETAISTVEIPSIGRFVLPPACVPYSPEFAPAAQRRGDEVLERLAQLTGGVERMDWAGVWQALPERPRTFALAPWLLAIAITLFLVEILERRTGLLSSIRFRRRADRKVERERTPDRPSRQAKRTKPRKTEDAKPADDEVAPPPTRRASDVESDMGETLSQAFRRAKGRTRRPGQ